MHQENDTLSVATGRDQLCYHGKHRYLSTAELHARHNYYKILFSHINYPLAACKCRAPTERTAQSSVYLLCKFVFYQHYPPFSQSQFMQLFQCSMQGKNIVTMGFKFLFSLSLGTYQDNLCCNTLKISEETETCNVCKYSSRSWIAGLRGETRSSRGEEMWFCPQTPVRLVILGRGDAVSSPGTRVPQLDYSKLILNSSN